MFIKFFIYRYALMYSLFNHVGKDKDRKREFLYRLRELETIMDCVLGFDFGVVIRTKATDISNKFTEDEISDKIKKCVLESYEND